MTENPPGPVVALYGGSFDPPHVAHVLAAAWLLSAAPVDVVWVMPVFRHPFGKPLAPWADRLAMCSQAFGMFAAACLVREDERLLAKHPDSRGRTIDLLDHLRAQHPDHRFRLVVGSDAIAERERWHRFDDIARVAPPLVLGRPGYRPEPGYEPAIVLPGVSSTDLRADLVAGRPVAGRLPREVAAWIEAKGLYR